MTQKRDFEIFVTIIFVFDGGRCERETEKPISGILYFPPSAKKNFREWESEVSFKMKISGTFSVETKIDPIFKETG